MRAYVFDIDERKVGGRPFVRYLHGIGDMRRPDMHRLAAEPAAAAQIVRQNSLEALAFLALNKPFPALASLDHWNLPLHRLRVRRAAGRLDREPVEHMRPQRQQVWQIANRRKCAAPEQLDRHHAFKA